MTLAAPGVDRAASRRGFGPRRGAPRRARAGRREVGSSAPWYWLRRAAAVLLGLAFLFPFYWTVVISLGRPGDFDSSPPKLLPAWQWSNWARAWAANPWPRLFLNTVLIASCTVALCLITSCLAGFAFGVLRFPGRKLLMTVTLSVLMMPATVLIIPDYVLASDVHWINTYWIQIVPWAASVFGIFLVRQFFIAMPQELLDAAVLDGASRLRVLRSICVPLARPALVIIAINVFMASWNSFLWPEIMTNTGTGSNTVQPIEVGLATYSSTEGTDYPALAAAATFTTLPVVVFFLILQRQFIRGAMSAAGGLRG